MKIAQQRGAVLVFTMLILMLVTLVGVNMIQQNRLQFMMAANSQRQTDIFANAEDLLTFTEGYLDSVRYDSTQPAFTCKKTTTDAFAQIIPVDITAGVETFSSQTFSENDSIEITETGCVDITQTEHSCCLLADSPDEAACSASGYCYSRSQSNCITELYSVKISSRDPDTGTERFLESKYAVRCDQ